MTDLVMLAVEQMKVHRALIRRVDQLLGGCVRVVRLLDEGRGVPIEDLNDFWFPQDSENQTFEGALQVNLTKGNLFEPRNSVVRCFE